MASKFVAVAGHHRGANHLRTKPSAAIDKTIGGERESCNSSSNNSSNNNNNTDTIAKEGKSKLISISGRAKQCRQQKQQ